MEARADSFTEAASERSVGSRSARIPHRTAPTRYASIIVIGGLAVRGTDF